MLFPQDSSVTQLTQDLAKTLGLKIRKAYVRSKVWMYDDKGDLLGFSEFYFIFVYPLIKQ